MFERFTEQAHRVVGLAGEEAEGLGHRYLGPEHLLLGILRDGASGAVRLLGSHGVGLETARAELLGLARQGVVPAPRPTDRALLGTLGIDLEAVRRSTEQAFGGQALAAATWRVTRRRPWRRGRVVWTPLCGPPFLAKRALHLASQQASSLGHGAVGPGHVLLGVLEDAREPAGKVRVPRRHRRITEHVGLPDGYQGATGPLKLPRIREAVEAPGHPHAEAVMILDHKRAIDYESSNVRSTTSCRPSRMHAQQLALVSRALCALGRTRPRRP